MIWLGMFSEIMKADKNNGGLVASFVGMIV